MRLILTLALTLLAALPSRADEQVVLGLSQNRVAITATFDGSDILIFGAVKRDTPIPVDDPIGVVVAIEGPSEPLTVRRKEKKYGIWINTDALEISSAPAFYAVATSAPFDEILNQTEDLRHHVSVPQAIRSVGGSAQVSDPEAFTEAVIRIRRKSGLYQFNESAVDIAEQTLFRTSVELPSNLTEGVYKTRIFLTRHGEVISHYESKIDVQKVGLERFLFNLSRERPLIYGLMSLVIAITAGWAASAFFRVFQRN
ncbi:TIGR02186 family protein [Alisedimentitalea sp. MJ-SS2]|uniref:TIGR02186 family protein n=1 Tax=Aliisedimentitalea sp. MJ-SS2 TaxID=3049795 RepID=UPI00290D110D|nr:TIGR02186 family protein [Alisedimentitalea sp. MJ-SS2]MDU8928779.1 TIGR02186 family protein [Alisedimentitalea sp. MJ-SS2]